MFAAAQVEAQVPAVRWGRYWFDVQLSANSEVRARVSLPVRYPLVRTGLLRQAARLFELQQDEWTVTSWMNAVRHVELLEPNAPLDAQLQLPEVAAPLLNAQA